MPAPIAFGDARLCLQLASWLAPPGGGLRQLQSCRELWKLRPQCLAPHTAGMWFPAGLAAVSLEALMDADSDICECIAFAMYDLSEMFKIGYHSSNGKFRVEAVSGSDSKDDEFNSGLTRRVRLQSPWSILL